MRQEFSTKTKAEAFLRSGGRCECGCGVKIVTGDGPEYDHRIPCQQGGDNSLDNCVVLRITCHKSKTRDDMVYITKSRRMDKKRMGTERRKAIIPGSKKSKFKKRLDGSVVLR